MSALVGIVLFVIGVVLAVWATERLLEGLVTSAPPRERQGVLACAAVAPSGEG